MSGESQSRSNAAAMAATGATSFLGGAAANEMLDRRLRAKGANGVFTSAVRTAARRPNGLRLSTHGPHVLGKIGTRGLQLASVPLIAVGAKNLVTGRDTPRVSVGRDLVRPAIRRATLQDGVAKGLMPYGNGWTLPKSTMLLIRPTKMIEANSVRAAQITGRDLRQLKRLRDYDRKELLSTHPGLRRGASATRLIVPQHVYGDISVGKDLSTRETSNLNRHRAAGRALSLTSGTLGLAALGLRAPSAAKLAVRRGMTPRGSLGRGIARLASREPAATRMSNTLGVGAIGVGSAGSFNYAAQQKLERKRDVSKVLYRGMSVNGTKLALKRGFVGSARGDIGPGLYATPDKAGAAEYGLPIGDGKRTASAKLSGRRTGRLLTIDDTGLHPIARGRGKVGQDRPEGFTGGWSHYEQVALNPADVTRDRIVRIDNVNRSTVDRLRARKDREPGGFLEGVPRDNPLAPARQTTVGQRLAGLKARSSGSRYPGDWRRQFAAERDSKRSQSGQLSSFAASGVGKSAGVSKGLPMWAWHRSLGRVKVLNRYDESRINVLYQGRQMLVSERDLTWPRHNNRVGKSLRDSYEDRREQVLRRAGVPERYMDRDLRAAKREYAYRKGVRDLALGAVIGGTAPLVAHGAIHGFNAVSRRKWGVTVPMPEIKAGGAVTAVASGKTSIPLALAGMSRGRLGRVARHPITGGLTGAALAVPLLVRGHQEMKGAKASLKTEKDRVRSVGKAFMEANRDRISPDAERGYETLRRGRNRAASYSGLSAGVAGANLAFAGRSLHGPRKYAIAHGLLALASGSNAARNARQAGSYQQKMRRIEDKARARSHAGLYGPGRGLGPVDETSSNYRKYLPVDGAS